MYLDALSRVTWLFSPAMNCNIVEMMRKFFFSFLISCFIFSIISCGKTTEENVNSTVSKTNDTIFGTGGDSGAQCKSGVIFQKNILVAVLASLGVILAAAYMLWLYRRVVFGKISSPEIKEMPDLNKIEIYIFGCLVFLTLFFGVYPEPLFNTINVSVDNLINQYQADINFYLTEANN